MEIMVYQLKTKTVLVRVGILPGWGLFVRNELIYIYQINLRSPVTVDSDSPWISIRNEVITTLRLEHFSPQPPTKRQLSKARSELLKQNKPK